MNEDIKKNISKNIVELRRLSGMTQLELAEKLNYSDKAVSKWESGASVPDITVLYEIAKIFDVTVDYLLSSSYKVPMKEIVRSSMIGRKHLIITCMSVMLCWLIATAVFVALMISKVAMPFPLWLIFVFCLPVSCIPALVLNSIWGNPKVNYIIISILMWSLLASIYLLLLSKNLWLIFLIGVPGEIIIILWSEIRRQKK